MFHRSVVNTLSMCKRCTSRNVSRDSSLSSLGTGETHSSRRSLPLAELALAVANKLKDRSAQARGLRAMGNALYASGENEAAILYHQRSRLMFLKAGNRKEVA